MAEHLIGSLKDGSLILSSQPNTLKPGQVLQIHRAIKQVAQYHSDPAIYRVGWDDQGWYGSDAELNPWH